MENPPLLNDSILVVAHPDDEALWFSSLVEGVREIIVCYLNVKSDPSLSEGRRVSLSDHPLGSLSCLKLEESEVFNAKNWYAPTVTKYGIDIKAGENKQKQYKRNFYILKETLYPRLKPYGHIFTHNPWGEYGHEEHVQLYRVIKSLQKDLDVTIWYPNYVSNKSLPLLQKTISNLSMQYISMPTQTEMGTSLKHLYESNSCWTWHRDWEWSGDEAFLREDSQNDLLTGDRPVPLNFIRVKIRPQTHRRKKRSVLGRAIKRIQSLR